MVQQEMFTETKKTGEMTQFPWVIREDYGAQIAELKSEIAMLRGEIRDMRKLIRQQDE